MGGGRTGGNCFGVGLHVDRATEGFLLPEMPRHSCEVRRCSDGEMVAVTTDSNSISFRRLCRSAIDHRRHSTDTGQYAIGTGGQFGGGGDNRGPALHHWQITASIALYAPRPHPQLLRIGFVPWKFQNAENLEYSNTLLAHWARRLLVLCGHSFKLMTLGMYWAATTITHDFHTRESSIKIIQYRRRMPRQSFHVGRCCHGAVVAMRGYCLSTTDVPKRALSKSRKGFLFWGYFWVFRHFQNSKKNVSH